MISKAVRRGVALMMLLGLALSFAWVLSLSDDTGQPVPTGYAIGGQPTFSCPVKASDGFRVTACYKSELYRTQYGREHLGMDMGDGSCGSPVRALEDGTATFLTKQGTYGTLVTITYDNGWKSRYAHMQDFAGFSAGTYAVKKADVVGHVGGECYGCAKKWPCHLHYELFDPSGKRVDPWYESCWDIPIKPGSEGYCTQAQMDHYNPGLADPELDSPDVPGEPPDTTPGIIPLAAKLEPNTYSFNPSFRVVKLDYTLDEYETLFGFAREVAGECQENQSRGVNPCVRGLMNGSADGFRLRSSNCIYDIEMPHQGFGTYEFCAVSEYTLPFADTGVPLGVYPVSYAFALILEDRTAPPAVRNLRAKLVSTRDYREIYEINWDPPFGTEDIDYYKVTTSAKKFKVRNGTSIEIVISLGTVGVAPVDYAGNVGPLRLVPIGYMPGP